MDDGWCGVCQTTTDGECLHYEDGTTIPNPRQEIARLRRLLEAVVDAGGCPECGDGRGWTVRASMPDGEPEQIQCMWCDETHDALRKEAP